MHSTHKRTLDKSHLPEKRNERKKKKKEKEEEEEVKFQLVWKYALVAIIYLLRNFSLAEEFTI